MSETRFVSINIERLTALVRFGCSSSFGDENHQRYHLGIQSELHLEET